MFAVVQLPVGILPAAGCTGSFLKWNKMTQCGYACSRPSSVPSLVRSLGLELTDRHSFRNRRLHFASHDEFISLVTFSSFEWEGVVYLYTSLNQ